jgi:hypothetical protein
VITVTVLQTVTAATSNVPTAYMVVRLIAVQIKPNNGYRLTVTVLALITAWLLQPLITATVTALALRSFAPSFMRLA